MLGVTEDPGIVALSVRDVFRAAETSAADRKFVVR